jgi:hypothetical protein
MAGCGVYTWLIDWPIKLTTLSKCLVILAPGCRFWQAYKFPGDPVLAKGSVFGKPHIAVTLDNSVDILSSSCRLQYVQPCHEGLHTTSHRTQALVDVALAVTNLPRKLSA